MDINDLRSLVLVLMLVTYLGLFAWVWARRNKARFDAAAQLPFQDADTPLAESAPEPRT